jgi:hypothetical protein
MISQVLAYQVLIFQSLIVMHQSERGLGVLIFSLAGGFDYGTEDDGRAFLTGGRSGGKTLTTEDTKVTEEI